MLTADDLERMTYMSTGEIKHMVELMRKTCKLISARHLIKMDINGYTNYTLNPSNQETMFVHIHYTYKYTDINQRQINHLKINSIRDSFNRSCGSGSLKFNPRIFFWIPIRGFEQARFQPGSNPLEKSCPRRSRIHNPQLCLEYGGI